MSNRIDRRSFLVRGAAAGAGVAIVGTSGGLLDACGSSSSSSTTSTDTHPDGKSSKTPKPGGSLIFGVDAEESGFSPTQGTYDEVGILYARTVFDPLMILDATGTPQPYLAESVTPSTDYTQWTITLRSGLLFHDGTSCDASAVAANFTAQKASLLTGPALTWADFGRRIAAALGRPARVLALPEAALRLCGRAADLWCALRGRPGIFSSQKVIEMLAPGWVASPDQAAQVLGWVAPTALDQALAATVAWYRNHGWL